MAGEHSNATILVVDDAEHNIRLLEHVIEREGYTVLKAMSGAEALQKVNDQLYEGIDLILLDIVMPDMNGFEVCRRLKKMEATKDIPVIFLSAKTEADSKVKGFDVGGVDYITKPFQRQETLARINLHIKLKNLQVELEEKVDELHRLNRDKDELMRIVSHDIRNPINGILGLTGILGKQEYDLSEEERKEMYDAIQESGNGLLKLVNDLLDKEKVKEINELQLVEVHLGETVSSIIELHQPTAINKNVRLQSDIEDVQPLYIDRQKFEQAVSNLVSNALKFTPEGGTVSVVLRKLGKGKSDDCVHLTVSDTGVGIPDEMLKSLWEGEEAEGRVRGGTSGEEGTGMGLQIIKNFTELHGGTVEVESEVDKGTSFHLYFCGRP